MTLRLKSENGTLKCEFTEMEKPIEKNFDSSRWDYQAAFNKWNQSFTELSISKEAREYLMDIYTSSFGFEAALLPDELSDKETECFEVKKMVNVQMINDEELQQSGESFYELHLKSVPIEKNQFTRIGTFCEKCRQVMCVCSSVPVAPHREIAMTPKGLVDTNSDNYTSPTVPVAENVKQSLKGINNAIIPKEIENVVAGDGIKSKEEIKKWMEDFSLKESFASGCHYWKHLRVVESESTIEFILKALREYKNQPNHSEVENQDELWRVISGHNYFNVKWSFGFPDELMQDLKNNFTLTKIK